MSIAFVAGATGLTGRETVRELVARGIETYAHVRPDSGRLAEWTGHFSALGAKVDTTAWDAAALGDRLRALQPDCVFALLGTTLARGKRSERETGRADTYESVDYGLTAMLLRATIASGKRSRFVYLSAIGVKEHAKGAYYAARARAEAEIRQSGLPFTIVRPSFIVGKRDDPRTFEQIGSRLADAALGLAGAIGARRLRDRYRSITAPELGAALVALALDPAAGNCVVEPERLRHTG